MKQALLLIQLIVSGCSAPVDYLRYDSMFLAKDPVEQWLRDAASDPVASAGLLKVSNDLKTDGCFLDLNLT